MTRRRLNRIRLDKIAAVDKPCQEHATFAIIKRAPDNAPPAIAKATFTEALQAQLVSERVSDVFWRAFEKQWSVREAFRESLTDEIAAGGDGSTATDGFVAAMRTLAESAAEAAREAGDTADTTLEAAVETAVAKWLNEQETQTMKITTKAALKAAVAAFNPTTSTVAELTAIQKAATDLNAEDELPVEGPLAKAAPKGDSEIQKRLDAAEREVKIMKLAPDAKAHFDGLDDAGKTAFLAKSAEDQTAIVKAANEGDPVVYTTTDGTAIRKSAGETAVLLAKRLDKQDAELAELRKTSATDSIAKRAAAFDKVPLAQATSLLKSADAVGIDTDDGKAILATLDSLNKRNGAAFTASGDEGDSTQTGDIAKARSTFEGRISEIAKRDSCPEADAMRKARVEYPAEFAAAYPAPADEDA